MFRFAKDEVRVRANDERIVARGTASSARATEEPNACKGSTARKTVMEANAKRDLRSRNAWIDESLCSRLLHNCREDI